MFHSPYCFFQKNYSEPHSQNCLYEASFLLQYLSEFHADQYYPATLINKTGVETARSIQTSCPSHRFIFYLIILFLTYLFRTLARSDGHIGHLLTVQVTAGLQSRPDHGIPFFC